MKTAPLDWYLVVDLLRETINQPGMCGNDCSKKKKKVETDALVWTSQQYKDPYFSHRSELITRTALRPSTHDWSNTMGIYTRSRHNVSHDSKMNSPAEAPSPLPKTIENDSHSDPARGTFPARVSNLQPAMKQIRSRTRPHYCPSRVMPHINSVRASSSQ